jgi:sigma-B regulation protein RsbU (phosphoserine phosphatase)
VPLDPEAATSADTEFLGALLDDDPEELYQHAPCAYLSTLPDGTIVKLNQTFTRWTGHDRALVVGRRRLQDLIPPGARIHYETHLAPLLRMQGHLREVATEIVCADGTRLPVILNAVAKVTADGTPVTHRVVLFDARERRSYERELLAALRRAEESEAHARELAETLQSSFLPPELLDVPGLDIAGVYRPAGDGSEVGGDFYDVFATGRDSWGVVLGDVSGKGAAAAPVTAVARYTMRAEAARTSSPAEILRATHEALLRTQPDRFCTALFLLLEPRGDAFQVTMASGGHHLPVLLRDGAISRVGATGSLLGMLDTVTVEDSRFTLEPGDVLVLHTDGVTEARHGTVFFDEDGLDRFLASTPATSARELSNRIAHHVVAIQAGQPRDDIALIVARVPHRP